MAMTQGEAVFQAVLQVRGEIDGAVTLTKDEKEMVHDIVLGFFQSGQTTHKSNPDEAALRKYIPGLVNNWTRKDPRLNGNTKYVAKRPGSRTGSGDESVKAMRALLSITTDADAQAAIKAEIEARVSALKPKPELNVAALPESLRHLVK